MATSISPECPIEPVRSDEPMVLKATSSRVGNAIIAFVVTAIINVVVYSIYFFHRDPIPTMGWVFLTVFAVVGVLAILGTIYLILKCFNPFPVLVCSHNVIHPGDEFELSWLVKGSTQSLKSLKISMTGEEQVSYRQGTSTRIEKNIFKTISIVETNEPDNIKEGFSMVLLPIETMHTFQAKNNKVTWYLNVSGDIPRWPDISDQYQVIVYPPAMAKT